MKKIIHLSSIVPILQCNIICTVFWIWGRKPRAPLFCYEKTIVFCGSVPILFDSTFC